MSPKTTPCFSPRVNFVIARKQYMACHSMCPREGGGYFVCRGGVGVGVGGGDGVVVMVVNIFMADIIAICSSKRNTRTIAETTYHKLAIGLLCYIYQIFHSTRTNMEVLHIPAWIRNHMPDKVWDEITYPFSIYNGVTVELLRVDKLFHPTHYNVCNDLSMLRLKLNHVS